MYGLKDLRSLDRNLVLSFLYDVEFRPIWDTDIHRSIILDLHNGVSKMSVCASYGIESAKCSMIIHNYVWWINLSEDDKQLFSLGSDKSIYNSLKHAGFKTLEDVVMYYKLHGSFSNITQVGIKYEREILKRLIAKGYDLEVPTYSNHDDSTLCVIYDKKEKQYLNCNGTLGSLSMAKVFNNEDSARDYIKCYMDFTSTEVRGVSLRLK